jgi:hypothetical protein
MTEESPSVVYFLKNNAKNRKFLPLLFVTLYVLYRKVIKEHMTRMKTRILWAVAALVLLAGCQKFGGSGKEIRFNAVTRPDAITTKTAYSGDLVGGVERINWITTDVIRIYSPQAACNNDNTYHWADYKPSTITASGVNSNAGALNPQQARGGLAWAGNGNYDFYAVYPSPADDPAATVRGTSTTPFECSIPAAQTGTATTVDALVSGSSTTVYYPPMSNAYLVAYDQAAKGEDIDLIFEPAYTAFHISAGAPTGEPDKVIKSVALNSTSTALAGAFTTYYNGSAWTYGITGTDQTVTFTFSTGNYTIAAGESVEFVLFALPQTLTDLTIVFTMGDDTTRSLKLKKNAADATTNSAGYINFAACTKHFIKGILIPESVWTVNNTTPVVLKEGAAADWVDEANSVVYGNTGPVVNASGLDEVSLSAHSYKFSIYEPHGQLWKIKVLDPSGNKVTGVNIVRDTTIPSGSSDSASGSGELTGTIRGGDPTAPALVEFHLTGTTGGINCTLSFSVVVNGVEYSINSEVVRGNWGSGTGDYKYINF